VRIKYSSINKRPSIPWRHQVTTLISTSAGGIPRESKVSHARDRAPDRLTVGILQPTRTSPRRGRSLRSPAVGLQARRLSCRKCSCAARLIRRWGDVVQLNTRHRESTPNSRTRSTFLARRFKSSCRDVATRLTQRPPPTPRRAIKLTFHFHQRTALIGAARRRGSAAASPSMTSWMTCVLVVKPRPVTNHGIQWAGTDADSSWTMLWTTMPEARCGPCHGDAAVRRPSSTAVTEIS